MNIFVTGISTNIGKTIAASVITKKTDARYWKPVQTGIGEGQSDSDYVSTLIDPSIVLKESYCLEYPASPDYAASLEKVTIDTDKIMVDYARYRSLFPSIVIEGAGGILVPLNEKKLMIDLVSEMEIPVLVVSRFYLGSINHTLLTIEALRARKAHVIGILFNGTDTLNSKSSILHYSKCREIGHIPEIEDKEINSGTIESLAAHIDFTFMKYV